MPSIGFEESEGFQASASPSGIAGWVADPEVIVLAGDVQSTGQFLQVAAAEHSVNASRPIISGEWGDKTVVYYDFLAKPFADTSTEPQTSIAADGAKLAFIKSGDQGLIAAFSATPGDGKSVISETTFPLGPDGKSQKWLRITVREDLANHKWDLYVDGSLVLANLGLDGAAAKPSLFSISTTAGQSLAVDSWQLADHQVLFADSDNDGMPDLYEAAHNLNPFQDDREVDLDGDGISNIEEFRRGTSPRQANASNRKTVYVDNRVGSNDHTGELPYDAASRGPKLTIQSAVDAIPHAGSVVLLPGNPFKLSEVNFGNKDIGLKPIGEIKAK